MILRPAPRGFASPWQARAYLPTVARGLCIDLWHRREIERAIAGLRVFGNFQLGDSDEALDLLAYALPVRVHRRWPGWIVIEPRPSP